jgi:hypothetical protein
MMPSPFHGAAQRGSIVMNIQRTHEDSDEDLGPIEVRGGNVLQLGRDPLLDAQDCFVRFHMLDVDDPAVGRAQDALTGRWQTGWISEKPNITPEKIDRKYCR